MAKTPRSPVEKEKSKGKGKEKADTSGKKKGDTEAKGKEIPVANDFHDDSIHDLAVRANILSGYEQFKVRTYPSWTFRCNDFRHIA